MFFKQKEVRFYFLICFIHINLPFILILYLMTLFFICETSNFLLFNWPLLKQTKF
jgi:hypothetical protein